MHTLCGNQDVSSLLPAPAPAAAEAAADSATIKSQQWQADETVLILSGSTCSEAHTGKAAVNWQETTGLSRGKRDVGRQAACCELLQDLA